jgi:hypothetical protein
MKISIKGPPARTDRDRMPHGRRTPILDRIAAALPGRREQKVLVLVNTVRGPVAVPVSKRRLFGRG